MGRLSGAGLMDGLVPTVEQRYGADAPTRFRRAGYWEDDSLTQWLDRWALERPHHRAVSDGNVEIDYSQLREQAYAFAGWLCSVGVKAGDRVAVQLPNWAEFVVAYLGVIRIGAVLVPIMPIYRDREVAHILESSRAAVVVTAGTFRGHDHAAMFRALRARAAFVRELVVVRADVQPGDVGWDRTVDTRNDADLGPHPGADLGHAVIYSSGTESTAKGCFHTWNTLGFTARGLAHDVFRMTPDDTMFMPSPVTHSTGIVIGIAVPLLVGAGIHLQDVWEPHEGLRRIEAFRCSITATATPFVRTALDAAKTSSHDLTSMRAWLCAGAPIPETLAHQFESVFTHGKLLPLYGCTEVMAATCCQLDDPVERIASSDGRIFADGVRIKIVDAQGREVPPGAEGEICYWGPGAILGYWGEPERTAAVIDAEGWHHCGDLGRMDQEGYLRVTGRLKDIIIRGGQNLSAREIEDHIASHPSVSEVAVVPFPDERLGERVCAFVVLREAAGLTLPELSSYLRDERRIAVQKVPERMEVVDALPMTATGKVQKFILRERVRPPAGPVG